MMTIQKETIYLDPMPIDIEVMFQKLPPTPSPRVAVALPNVINIWSQDSDIIDTVATFAFRPFDKFIVTNRVNKREKEIIYSGHTEEGNIPWIIHWRKGNLEPHGIRGDYAYVKITDVDPRYCEYIEMCHGETIYF